MEGSTNNYAEFLALKKMVEPMLTTLEHNLECMSDANTKYLIKLQKSVNNYVVKMVAKIPNKPHQMVKIATVTSEHPTTVPAMEVEENESAATTEVKTTNPTDMTT